MSDSRFRLLVFSNAPVRGGAEEHILQLLTGLDRSLFAVYFACTPELLKAAKKDLPDDVEVFTLTLDGPRDVRGALKLAQVIRKRRIQILHSHMFRASLFASPIAWLCGVPLIVETAHIREYWRGTSRRTYMIDRFAAKVVHSTVAVSGAVRQFLVEQKGLPPEKITVIPTAPALCADTPRRGDKAALGFGNGVRLIVLAGRLEPQKGHRVLIEAMPAVVREFPNVRLVCLGEGSLRRQLEQMVAQKGLSAHVHFAGYRANIAQWFASADLSVLPSFFEGMPMTVLEALRAGCPVVATAVDGTVEIIEHGKTGLLVPPGNASALAETVIAMLRDPERARSMAEAGRERVQKEFTVERMVERTEQFYLREWERQVATAPQRVKSVHSAAAGGN